MIRTQCEGCGACCRAIWLPKTHEELERTPRYKGDIEFVKENFYPLTAEEVLERNPHVATWGLHPRVTTEGLPKMLENNFYGCKNYDEEARRCRIWADRPEICRGYPWYDREPTIEHLFYDQNCFYKRDLPLELPEGRPT